MKLSEFKQVMSFLPEDTEVYIGNTPKTKSTLKEEHWGNHDGRYNVKCTTCGWASNDIHIGEYKPEFCPKGCRE